MATDGPIIGNPGAGGFAPCFPVRDMQAALAHYQRLGFEVMPYTPGMTWAWARLGPAELHLFVKDDHDPASTAAAADLQVENADEFGRALRETGADGTSDSYDTPYGREFVHVDPDNNLIRFVTPAAVRTETTATRRASPA
jgi:catechol 2,3-dioxygenase-like lactoylglutathione lyase family enzyme